MKSTADIVSEDRRWYLSGIAVSPRHCVAIGSAGIISAAGKPFATRGPFISIRLVGSCTGGLGAPKRRGVGEGEQGRRFPQIHSPGLRFSLAKRDTSACVLQGNSEGKPMCWKSRSLSAKPEGQ